MDNDQLQLLLPVLVLITWTVVMFFWMYATRIPAMQKSGMNPDDARHPGTYFDKMSSDVRSVADNYNHLHEQPTLFYALMFYIAVTDGGSQLVTYLSWGYVILRIAHSFVQVLSPKVLVRFSVFALASLALVVLTVNEVIRVIA